MKVSHQSVRRVFGSPAMARAWLGRNRNEILTVLNLFAALFVAYAAWSANAISRLALEFTQLSKPSISIVVDDPLWQFDHLPGSKLAKLSLVSTLTIANTGAQPGCISIVLVYMDDTQRLRQWRLKPFFFIDPNRLYNVTPGVQSQRHASENFPPIQSARSSRFLPIVVLGKSQVTHSILFIHPAFSTSMLESGTYRIRWITADCDKQLFTTMAMATYQIPASEIPIMLSGALWTRESTNRQGMPSVAPDIEPGK